MLPTRNGNTSKQSKRKSNILVSLRGKNKELASALDAKRKEVTILTDHILKLKEERQKVMEKSMFYESKLNIIDSLYSNTAKPLIVKTISAIEAQIKDAMSFSSAVDNNEQHTHIISTSMLQLSTSQKSTFRQGIQLSSTPLKEADVDESPIIPSPVINDTPPSYQLEISNPVSIDCSRPKRSCTSLITSYQEPSCNKKLRQGDPFTTSFNYSSNFTKMKQEKTKQQKNRKGLKDITNARV